MKVVCIHNPHLVWNITEGKIYDIFDWDESRFAYIIDDSEKEFILEGNYHCFLPLDKYRQKQLDKII
jgi:hypothetical protein